MIDYKGMGRLIASYFTGETIDDEKVFVILVDIGDQKGFPEWVVSSYRDGCGSWNQGHYHRSFPDAARHFSEKMSRDVHNRFFLYGEGRSNADVEWVNQMLASVEYCQESLRNEIKLWQQCLEWANEQLDFMGGTA